MKEWLYKRTSSGKIQSWKASTSFDSDLPQTGILVKFGQLNGKIQQVLTIVSKGKQKRNHEQQAEFEIKALYKGKKDEGYKSLDDLGITNLISLHGDPALCLQEKLEEHLPKHNTNKEGHLKVMLSQPISKTVKGIIKEFWDKVEYPCALEPKLDGVRCTIQRKKESHTNFLFDIPVLSLSRESMTYDFGTVKIREKLVPIFEKYPDLILDGELYKHDIPQNHISGAMRSIGGGEYKYVFDIMEFHVYDIVDVDLTFRERRQFLEDLHNEFPDAFFLNPLHIVNTKEEIDVLEEQYVSLDYEGIMLKMFKGMYRPNVRSYDSLKVKRFYDAEYKITGYEIGSRGVQDLVLIFALEGGDTFKATVHDTLENKQKMVHNMREAMDNIPLSLSTSKYIGRMGTVKYKFISENGKPSHANFKGLR